MNTNATEFVPTEVWKAEIRALTKENSENKYLASSWGDEVKKKDKLISALQSTIDNNMACMDVLHVQKAEVERLVETRDKALIARCDELAALASQFHDVREKSKRVMLAQKCKIEDLEKDVLEWQKKSMRLQYIIEQMNRVGAIRLPENEWALDMADEIKFPDGSVNSVYNVVPYELRQQWLPSATDNVGEIVDEVQEEEVYMRLSEEARAHSQSIREYSQQMYMYADIEPWATGSAVHIQRMWRGFRYRQLLPKVEATTYIQRIWRGFHSRGIRYYEKRFPIVPSNRFTLRRSLRLINTSSDYTYEIIFIRGDILATTLPRNTYENRVIETYAKDQWKVRCVQTDEERYFRVPVKGDGRSLPGSIDYVFDLATGISLEYTQEVRDMLYSRWRFYDKYAGWYLPVEHRPFYALKVKKEDGWLRIGRLLIKEIEDELYEDFTQGMFAEDERAWTLEYLEFHWRELYRKHYDLGWRDPWRVDGHPIPITLSYDDYVCLSRGTHY
jgi:hypothetical protein